MRATVFFDLRTAEDKVVMPLKMLKVLVDPSGICCVLGVAEETVLAWLRRAAHQAEAINRPLLLAPLARKASSFCKDRERLQQRVVFFQAFYHVARPHMSLRQPLPLPERTPQGLIRPRWQQRTPAMAAWLTDHVWTFREVLTAKFEPLDYQSISG